MSEGLGGSADFFGRIPLFREFARLMATGGGPVNWELARRGAVATAAGAEDLGMTPQLPRPAATPDPGEARAWDDRLRLAELWVDPVSSLPATGVALAARPLSRPDWAEAVLGGFVPLVEPGARRVAEALVGQLARSVLGQYELAMAPDDPAKVLLVPENVLAFEQAADLPGDQLRLWLACHQVAGQGLLGPPSAALQAATGRLEVLLALTAGYPLVIAGRALEGRLPGLAAIEAAVGRRGADPQSPGRLFALLLRVDPDRASAARGERFCREVLGATDIDGLDLAWSHPESLPTAEELDVPGRWLERVGLIGGDEVDLDEGLRALLEAEDGDRGQEPEGDRGEEPEAGGDGDDRPRPG